MVVRNRLWGAGYEYTKRLAKLNRFSTEKSLYNAYNAYNAFQSIK